MQLARLAGNPDIPVTQHPQYLQAKAQVDEAQRQLDHTVVKAPFAGIVTNVPSIAPGKYLAASTTAFYLVATDHVWIDATPKETELTYVRPGQPVTVTVDTYPDAEWHGIVESISPAAAQQFSLLPAQNTSGNWVKVVQRIPMRVRIDTSDKNLPPLRAGMSVEVDVDTGHARGLPHFLAALFGRAQREHVMPAERAPDGGNRAAITVCVILATLMQALDTTIANVALPYMQGSVSASQDQIDWVLTSYIVAAAIMTPPTGFLAGRFGLKRLFLVSVAGFTVASMLCGMAQSLVEIVLFRILQGLFGAALVPLSQTVLLNINPKERQGSAMALWGVAVMAGPVLGPVLGGWLTEAYSWRYVFYINLPIGVLAFLGMTTFLPETARNATAKAGLVRLRHPEPRDRRHAGAVRPRRSSSTGSAPARSSSRPSSPPRRSTCFSSIPSPRTSPS